MCYNCNQNNTPPEPLPENDPCNPCLEPCDSCGNCDCTCADPGYLEDGCYSTQTSECITYAGAADTCIPLQTGNKLTLVIQRIAAYLKNIFNNVTSDSLVITPSGGTCNSALTIELEPSADANNQLVLGTDGKPYVPGLPTVYVDNVIINDTDCLTFTKTFINGVITFTPIIDWACVAGKVCNLCTTTPCPPVINLEVAVT